MRPLSSTRQIMARSLSHELLVCRSAAYLLPLLSKPQAYETHRFTSCFVASHKAFTTGLGTDT